MSLCPHPRPKAPPPPPGCTSLQPPYCRGSCKHGVTFSISQQLHTPRATTSEKNSRAKPEPGLEAFVQILCVNVHRVSAAYTGEDRALRTTRAVDTSTLTEGRSGGQLAPGHRVGQTQERQGTCLTRGSRGHSPARAEGHLHTQEWPRVRGKRRNQKRSENSPVLRLTPCPMASSRVPTPARTHTCTPHSPDAALRMPGYHQRSQGFVWGLVVGRGGGGRDTSNDGHLPHLLLVTFPRKRGPGPQRNGCACASPFLPATPARWPHPPGRPVGHLATLLLSTPSRTSCGPGTMPTAGRSKLPTQAWDQGGPM